MYYILSKLFYLLFEKKKLFGYSMSVLLPEAVQIHKFEITDEEVSLLHVECVHDFLSRLEQNSSE